MNDDERFIRRAINLAKKGEGFTSPNPLVGAVIVKENRIIADGYHKKVGAPHAEIEAIKKVSDANLLKGATLYVNLEPCCHFGKTPPCVDVIIQCGISNVKVGMLDVNPAVCGRGVELLKKAGIKVKVGILQDECKKLNEIFIKFITTNFPFIAVKTSAALDGKIATSNFESRWITDEISRNYAHKIRLKYDAILVGINTIKKDNPQLTVRKNNKIIKVPYKIILDSKLKIPLNCNVLNHAPHKTIIATLNKYNKEKINFLKKLNVDVIFTRSKNNKIDIRELLKKIAKKNISSVLIEGGGEVNFSAIHSGIVDKIYFFFSPKIIGGRGAPTICDGDGIKKLSDAVKIKNIKIIKLKQDFLLEGYL